MCSSGVTWILIVSDVRTRWHLFDDNCQTWKEMQQQKKHMLLQAPDKTSRTSGTFSSISSCDLLCCFFFSVCVSEAICFHHPAPPLLSPTETLTGFKKQPNISCCIHFPFPLYFVVIKPFTSKHRLTSKVKLSLVFLLPRAQSWGSVDNSFQCVCSSSLCLLSENCRKEKLNHFQTILHQLSITVRQPPQTHSRVTQLMYFQCEGCVCQTPVDLNNSRWCVCTFHNVKLVLWLNYINVLANKISALCLNKGQSRKQLKTETHRNHQSVSLPKCHKLNRFWHRSGSKNNLRVKATWLRSVTRDASLSHTVGRKVIRVGRTRTMNQNRVWCTKLLTPALIPVGGGPTRPLEAQSRAAAPRCHLRWFGNLDPLGSDAVETDVWNILLSLLPPRPDPGWVEENGWTDEWTNTRSNKNLARLPLPLYSTFTHKNRLQCE